MYPYDQSTNLSYLDELIGSNVVNAGKTHQTKYWGTPPINEIQMPPGIRAKADLHDKILQRLLLEKKLGIIIILVAKIIAIQ